MTKDEAVSDFWRVVKYNKKIVSFVMELLDGTTANLNEINAKIETIALNWQIERMASTDRAILRLGAYELLYMPHTPSDVVINEAIELAKEFSTRNSGRFVNAILDKIKKQDKKKPVNPAPSATEQS